MDEATPSKKPRTTAAEGSGAGSLCKVKSSGLGTPEKMKKKLVAAADLLTPEKMEPRPFPRSGGSGGRAPELQQRAGWGPAVVDALESVERELGVGAGAGRNSVKRRPEVKLPESYEMLCKFFNCFKTSTRLLRMKGSMAIVINKILLGDQKTCCMKPDLQVNLLVDSIEESSMHKGETGYSALRRMFKQRLVDFFRKHPEGDGIPEHELLYPFTQTNSSVAQITPRVVTEAESAMPSPSLAQQHSARMSHMSQTFKRRFSQRSSTCPSTASATSLPPKARSTAPSPLNSKSVLSSTSSGIDHESQVQEKGANDVALRFGVTEGTPSKFRPISATVCDTPPLKSVKRSARAKFFMTPTKDASIMEAQNPSTSISAGDGDDELLSFLPKSLLQSEKEQRALEELETGIADQVQRQKITSCLPSTFDIIFLIYQSRQRYVLTKHELIRTIIESNPKIVDKGEVEEQLKQLLEFVPEWICEKTASNGDVLCCVDTTLSQAEV
ncbi:hypothetical protein VPH35_084960 [Triticum aestivum]